jgi:hypothetical protein
MNGIFIHVVLDHDIVDANLVLPDKTTDNSAALTFLKFNHDKPGIPLEGIQIDQDETKQFLIQCTTACPHNALLKSCWSSNHLKRFFMMKRSKSDCMSYLLQLLYQSIGVNMMYLPVSQISASNTFQAFCTDLFSDITSFIIHYNNAISSSKQFIGISKLHKKTIQSHTFTKVPLWLLCPNHTRKNLWISFDKDNLRIACEDTILITLGKDDVHLVLQRLSQKGYSIRPKAVLLTCFLRLYLCDWFIHGIGGTRYEAISGYLLKHYWEVDGLSYGTASLTSYLLEEQRTAAESTLGNLCRQFRLYTHQPETLLTPEQSLESKVNELIQGKKDMITRSSDQSLSSHEREKAWGAIKNINLKLQKRLPCSEKSLHNAIKTVKKQLPIFQKRDFFFGLFSKERLNSFSEAIDAEFQ